MFIDFTSETVKEIPDNLLFEYLVFKDGQIFLDLPIKTIKQGQKQHKKPARTVSRTGFAYEDDKQLYELFIANNFNSQVACKEFVKRNPETSTGKKVSVRTCLGRLISYKCHGSFGKDPRFPGAWQSLDFKNGSPFFTKEEYTNKVLSHNLCYNRNYLDSL